jgi:transcriptional regulator with XRE-family HTH domain
MSFGEIIREARQNAGLSLDGLASQLGVTKVYVSDVERGLRKPFTQERIRQVASILDLDPAELSWRAASKREFITLPTESCSETKLKLAGAISYYWLDMSDARASAVLNVINGG